MTLEATSRRKKIGIFGGSFDPPHRAHLEIVKSSFRDFDLDEIIIVPSQYPPGKTPVASFEKRFEWTARLFEGVPHVRLSDYERSSSQTVFAKQIFSSLAVENPKAQYFWLLGEDNFNQLSFWWGIDSYASELHWLVFPRHPAAKPRGFLSKRLSKGSCSYSWTSGELLVDVASYRIREAIQKQEKSEELNWVPESIQSDVLATYRKGEPNA